MEYFNKLNQLQTGFLNPVKFGVHMSYRMYSRVCKESANRIISPVHYEIFDFAVDDNWLLAAHSRLYTTIYNVGRAKDEKHKVIASWNHELPANTPNPTKICSYECVNWNSKTKYFTVSGASPYLYFNDTVTVSTVEEIIIPGATKIYQHKPQPQNNAVIAIASDLKTLAVVDLRTGNVSFTVKQHGSKVRSVAWSPLHECILASSSDTELYLWDTRMTKKPKSISVETVGPSYQTGSKRYRNPTKILPEVQFVPGSNKLVGMSTDRRIYMMDNDFSTIRFQGIIGAFPNCRYKFSLIGGKPHILFIPAGNMIQAIDINRMRVLNELTGHVFPVRATIFNPLKNELYSAAKDGIIIWEARKF